MKTAIFVVAVFAGLATAAAAQAPAQPAAGTVIEQSNEYRFQIDLHVTPAVLTKLLPAGWESAAATQGAAKDANLRMIFIDRVNIVGPDNKVLGNGVDRLVYLAAPVRQIGSTGTSQMILGGISENDPDAVGAFGTLVKASRVSTARTITTANGATIVTEDWDFAAAGGERIQMHVKYTRGPANRAVGETKFFNPTDPTQWRVFRTDQATDITRNVTTTPPDRVMEFSYKAGGGRIAALFDGAEKPLSWDAQPAVSRTIVAP